MKKFRFTKTIMEVEKDEWNGESIEEKVKRATSTNQPIEAVAPMIYTERKEGVKKEYDIRADKWEIAQEAMTRVSESHREKRQQRIEQKEQSKTE